MILGPSGQNIYPEDIEERLNGSPYIDESLAIGEDNKIVALIVPDTEALEKEGIEKEKWEELIGKSVQDINKTLPTYSRIASFRMQDEFEKTPKRSIRRFKYQE